MLQDMTLMARNTGPFLISGQSHRDSDVYTAVNFPKANLVPNKVVYVIRCKTNKYIKKFQTSRTRHLVWRLSF